MEDEVLFEVVVGYNYVVVLNKIDLEIKFDINRVCEFVGENLIVFIFLVNDEGLEVLEEVIKILFFVGDIDVGDVIYVLNVWYIVFFY